MSSKAEHQSPVKGTLGPVVFGRPSYWPSLFIPTCTNSANLKFSILLIINVLALILIFKTISLKYYLS